MYTKPDKSYQTMLLWRQGHKNQQENYDMFLPLCKVQKENVHECFIFLTLTVFNCAGEKCIGQEARDKKVVF